MAREIERLDDVQIRHWMRAGEPVAKADGYGLTFTLSKAGTAAWVMRYRFGGRPREVTLGNHPALSLAAARKQARALRVEIANGGDPAATKRKEKQVARSAWTVKNLIKHYREHVLPGLAPNTQHGYNRNLRRIEAKLGALMVGVAQPSDVIGMIEDAARSWTESALLLSVTRVLFDYAVGRKLIPVNPTVGIKLKHVIGACPPVRQRIMLTEAELRQLLAGPMSRANALAIRILLATCARSMELGRAEWRDVDLDAAVWHVPETNVKGRRAIDIPLVPVVVKWFGELRRLSGGSRYVLPARAESRHARHGGDAPVGRNALGEAIDAWRTGTHPEMRRFTPHDLRSTARSWLSGLRVPSHVAEACLNHKLAGVVGVYDKYVLFDERRQALTRWAEFLVLHEPGRENVVSIRKDAA